MAFFLERLCARFRLLSFENKAIMHGMGRVAVFLLFAKIIAAVKEILVAYYYGTSAVVDGFLFAFNLIMWPGSVFFSVASFVLIPYLVSMRVGDPGQESHFRSELLLVTIVIGAVASMVTGGLLFGFVESGLAGLSTLGQQAALVAIPWLAPTVAFACLAALYSSWLMSERRHANTFLESMPALCIVLTLFFWVLFDLSLGQSPLPLVVGTLVGFALQAGVLARLSGGGFQVAWPAFGSPHWQNLRRVFGVMLLAQIIMTTSGMVDQFFAARMGEGVLAVYSYAQRVMGLLLGFSAVVIGRALLPVLSGITDARASWKIAKRWAVFLGLLGGGGAAVFALLANPIVKMLFERGAFTAGDTVVVSEILVVLGIQLPFYLAGIVLIQWVGVVKMHRILLLSSLIGFFTKFFFVILFSSSMGIGLAYSTVFMYFSTCLVLYFSIKNHVALQMYQSK